MNKKKKFNPDYIPPKISQFIRTIKGQDKKIWLVRKVFICRLLKKEVIIIGRIILARNSRVSLETFNKALDRMRQ